MFSSSGMRGDHEDASQDVELVQSELDLRGPGEILLRVAGRSEMRCEPMP